MPLKIDVNRWPRPLLIGMCHLPPLPGSPRYGLEMGAVVEHAVRDARTLREAGFDALIVENFGDAPFAASRIAPWTTAALAIVVAEVKSAAGMPVGVNALRNDALAALGIAAAAGGDFVRVNILVGVSATDQGFIQGQAAELLCCRQRIAPTVEIFADVHVKHAVCISQPDIALAAEETAYRGQADALIVSGATTGRPADLEELQRVRRTVPDRLLLAGSGVTPETVGAILEVADGVIVGSCLKPGGNTDLPIDLALANAFMKAARPKST
ncbi:MAG: BtpA/SgcQ family protein [Phycisphaerae bacterium]|nr:BtpA/SgcQ family protein [Phycisphaerae bacterium]